MRFSQRIGKTTVRDAIQLESIDQVLTNRLWNILNSYFNSLSESTRFGESDRTKFFEIVWCDFFRERADQVKHYKRSSWTIFRDGQFYFKPVYDYVNDWFFDCAWYEKLDLIEFVAQFCSLSADFGFSEKINNALEREMSAYRIIDNKVLQITSELEVSEIEEAILDNDNSVREHLNTALKYLSDRKSPDYRNSIKESISAVEALCQKITGDSKTTLGKALAKIEKDHLLHSSLKSSFSSLYGYTSDASGIRHALTDETENPSFEEAKFMLVSCSAFINYLKSFNKK